jgi:anhydro-N-acetylmuramic acid kinase
MKIVGLISGTSYDAIDVAAAEFSISNDVLWLTPLGALEVPYQPELRTRIATALPPGQVGVEQICRLDTELGKAFAAAAQQGVAQLCEGTADLIVSHGQTIYHWVDGVGQARGTLQLGQPAWIAERTSIPVISDLRSADIARGGQGAPLVPIFDVLLLGPDHGRPRATLNLGGIANMTVIGGEGEPPLGYDLGPANALIDAATCELFGKPYDAGGIRAATGRVCAKLLDTLLDEPFYAASPPKSTGKELFHWDYLAARLGTLSEPVRSYDVVATVTELTAQLVASECVRNDVMEVLVSGGGVHNPVLMNRLTELTNELSGGRCVIRPIDSLGIPADAKEAYAFALLGWFTWNGLPGSLPSTTGAHAAVRLGSITPGNGPLRLPPPLPSAPRRLRIQARTKTAARLHC